MEALFAGQPFDDHGQPESVTNILARYHDIEEQFPKELTGEALPYFADWLIENVHLVKITAYSDEDAYTIFETMNDRGLSLTATDMLKGYLLANISDSATRTRASNVWRDRIAALQKIGKEEDADAIKGWLRSQYAQSIRERKPGASPRDFDLLGTEFHRWVRDNQNTLNLCKSSDFANFIERDFSFYSRQYIRIRAAADKLTPGLEAIHYNAQNNFTLQYPVLLAPLRPDDSDPDILRKLRVTAAFLDILITRRIWNFHAIDYSTLQYAMFLVMKDIRGRSPSEVANLLTQRLAAEPESFSLSAGFSLHGTNGRQIHRLLARLTDYVETQSGQPSRYAEYVLRKGKKGCEIEHILANHPERYTDEFKNPYEFRDHRNLIGGLLLLPKSFNASYGDLPYAEKLEHYLKQNLLAQSLHPKAYDRHPGFQQFIKSTGLPFRPHPSFKKPDMEARCALYIKLAERIWDPKQLLTLASA